MSYCAELRESITFPTLPSSALATSLKLSARNKENRFVSAVYRVTLVVVHLGWVDLDIGSSQGCLAAIVATYCPGRMVEHHKYKSTQPRCTTTSVTLYVWPPS